jgi:hypothetical protein
VQNFAYEPDWGHSSKRFAYIHNGRIRIYSIRSGRKRTVVEHDGALYDLDWAPC